MNVHDTINDLLPVYVSGKLDATRRQQVETHLAGCAECRSDLALWRGVSAEIVTADRGIVPPASLAERALQHTALPGLHGRRGIGRSLHAAWQLLWAQAPLVQRELWPASALIIALGCIVALIAKQAVIIQVLAPLIAAGCMALLYGSENDPAIELALATITSPWQILLARLALVYSYNLALMLAAGLALLAIVPAEVLGGLIVGWLGPMTFLSALALLLSMWFDAGNAASIAYVAWLSRWLIAGVTSLLPAGARLPAMDGLLGAYLHFWELPPLLFALAAILVVVALWLAGRHRPALQEGTA